MTGGGAHVLDLGAGRVLASVDANAWLAASLDAGEPADARDHRNHCLPHRRVAGRCKGETHGGWQDGDGAYGEFVFDIAGGTVTLDHNERYTATESYSHTF